MPTVIVLDVSLSMTRFVPGQSSDISNKHTYHSLAVQGIHQFLEYLSETSRLEHVSLVSTFSTIYAYKNKYVIRLRVCLHIPLYLLSLICRPVVEYGTGFQ